MGLSPAGPGDRTSPHTAPPAAARPAPGRPAAAGAARGLAAVCGAVTLLGLALVPPTLELGWDEIVYASRFGPHGPPVPFSAPRTRGVPLLLAPVAAWTGAVVLLRAWLLLLFAAALHLGFRPWLRVADRPWTVPVAAGLYGTLWITLFYANSAMPNHYTAMGATAAAGALAAGRPAAVAAGVAVATLMRPNDGVALAAPLLLAALLVPAWRDRGRLAGPAAGLVAGALPWVVEAQLRFGGVRERLAEASGIQGGLRPVFSLPAHLTAWDGPLLCRPCGGDTVRPEALPWWLLLPSLVALGLWSARRGRAGAARTADGAPAPPAYRLAVLVALCCAAPYLFLVPYAAPRFLLPAYALLAVPAAAGLLLLVRVLPRPGPGRRRARAGATLLLALVPAHLVMQVTLVLGNARIQQDARADWHRITRVLRDLGVREPCVLKANSSFIPVAHTAGCRPARWRAPVEPDAVVLRRREPPGWARRWPSRPVPGTYNPGWTVAVRPGR